MFFDAKEYHTTNKQVANILSSDKSGSSTQANEASASNAGEQRKEVIEEPTLENMDGGEWGDEEDPIDIDMGEDLMGAGDRPQEGDAQAVGAGPDGAQLDSDIFVPPSAGADPLQQALKKNP